MKGFRKSFLRDWAALLLFGFLAGTGLSCSSEPGNPLYPVRGQVLYNGQPLAEAIVVFHPLGGQSPDPQKPLAYTDSAGKFNLTTHQPGDGALPGEYAVTVELRQKVAIGGELVRDGRNLLPAHYGKPRSSGWHCRVTKGPNEVPAFRLTGPAIP